MTGGGRNTTQEVMGLAAEEEAASGPPNKTKHERWPWIGT